MSTGWPSRVGIVLALLLVAAAARAAEPGAAAATSVTRSSSAKAPPIKASSTNSPATKSASTKSASPSAASTKAPSTKPASPSAAATKPASPAASPKAVAQPASKAPPFTPPPASSGIDSGCRVGPSLLPPGFGWQSAQGARQLAAARRPMVLRRRQPAAAATLGFLIGLGTGFYYAGAPRQAAVFTAVDAALWAGLVGTTVALNELVVKNDFRTGKSLQRGERHFGLRENNLYIASWVVAALLVVSHGYQGFASLAAAHRTNHLLRSLSVTPLPGGGGAVQLRAGF